MANHPAPHKSHASAAPVTVSVSAPPEPPQDSDEVAALKAELAALKAAQVNPFTPGQIDDAIAASMVPEVPGTTVRPTIGPLHPTAKTPIFNGARPTGKAG